MPYISKTVRDYLDSEYIPDVGLIHLHPGELNYVLTKILLQQVTDPTHYTPAATYDRYNAIIGVLESVKLEFYRRAIVPYEEKKMKENGDVYTL